MGMFDNLRCEMPLPPEAPKAARDLVYQTKDLECGLLHYVIRGDGTLVDANIRMERKPNAPHGPKDILSKEYLEWYRKWWERKEGPDIACDYTGAINFYADHDGGWLEFCALVKHGRVIDIVVVELPNIITSSLPPK